MSVDDSSLPDFVTQIYIEEPPPIIFAGHNKYILSVAKHCRNEGLYTDIVLHCSDGQLKAHKLVLASAGKFLKHILIENLDEVTHISLSEFREEVVQPVLDYIYTGKLVVNAQNAPNIHSLITALGIDQDDVSVDTVEPRSNPVSKYKIVRKQIYPEKSTEKDNGRISGIKRRASTEASQTSMKRLKVSENPSKTPTSGSGALSTASKRVRKPKAQDPDEVPSGFHDMSRTDTWVCAICEYYDPPIDESSIPMTTDWIGCDCNRWYHKHCTKLNTFDDTFSCKNVNLQCLTT